ncbi:hypothetical protein MTO96_048122 [Rhipicephalus appendiculatus]
MRHDEVRRQRCSGHISCTLAVNKERGEGGGGLQCHKLGSDLRGVRKRMRSSRSQLVCLTVRSRAVVVVAMSSFSSNPCRPEMSTGGREDCTSPRPVRCRLLTKPRRAERTGVRDVDYEKACVAEVKE